ncbi:MAG: DNA polymerase III subunit delta [Alphaproteobacteria bacterium]
MKILPNNVDRFLSAPPNNIKSILIYGPDNGLASERVQSLTRKLGGKLDDPFNIFELNYDKVKDHPYYLKELIYSISLTGQRKIIKIISVSSNINPELCEILSNIKTQNIVIMIAGELPPSSSVRKFFETNINSASIACYTEENQALRSFISNYLKKHNFTYENGVIEQLEELISGDRFIIKNELDKLMTYVGDRKNIQLSDIENCNINLINASMEEFCQYLICRDVKSINIFTYLLEENISPISIIRNIVRYIIRLYQAKLEMEKGKTIKDAISTLSPALFFKQVPIFTKALNIWSVKELINLLENLTQLEIACKKTGTPVKLICERLLINLVK